MKSLGLVKLAGGSQRDTRNHPYHCREDDDALMRMSLRMKGLTVKSLLCTMMWYLPSHNRTKFGRPLL